MSGMETADPSRVAWRKSSRSTGNGGDCVEVAPVWRKSSRSGNNGGACVEAAPAREAMAVRDSKDPEGPALAVHAAHWRALVAGIKDGTLDHR